MRKSKIKGFPTLTARKKKPALKNSAFTKFNYVAEGRYIREEKSPSFVSRTRVQQYARSEVRVPRRAATPLWRVGYAECCGQEQLRFDRGSVASKVEAPTGAMLLLCATQVCCAVGSTAVASSPCICAWHLYFE